MLQGHVQTPELLGVQTTQWWTVMIVWWKYELAQIWYVCKVYDGNGVKMQM